MIKLFAVTVAFTVGSAVIVLLINVASLLFGRPVVPSWNVTSWYQLSLTLTVAAAFAGVLVDVIRYIGSMAWTRNLKFGIKFKKLLRRNLA